MSLSMQNAIEQIDSEIKDFLKTKRAKESQMSQCKYNIVNSENVSQNIAALSEEFSLFGIRLDIDTEETDCSSDSNTIISLCNAVWPLMNKFKQMREIAQNCELDKKRIQQDNEYLQKTVQSLKKEAEDKNYRLISLKMTIGHLERDLELANKEIVQLKVNLDKLRKQQLSKETQRRTEVKRSEVQLNMLQEKFRGQCGLYTSRDKTESKTILDMKKRENQLKETISKLEANNNELIHDILNLKEELALRVYDENKNNPN